MVEIADEEQHDSKADRTPVDAEQRAISLAMRGRLRLGDAFADADDGNAVKQLVTIAEAQPWCQEAWRDFVRKAQEARAQGATEVRNAREAAWRDWARWATDEAGAGKAHSWTKLPDRWAPATVSCRSGSPTSAVQTVVDAQQEHFMELWEAKTVKGPKSPLPEPCQRTALPLLTPSELRRASGSCKKRTAVGLDGIPMRMFARLSDACLESLALLFEAMEKTGCIPPPWEHCRVPLIPKKAPGKMRAIGIFSGPCRLWAKARRPVCDRWEAAHQQYFFAAGGGRRPLQPVWREATKAEWATSRGRRHEQLAAAAFFDIEAFYDTIPNGTLRHAAAAHHFPQALLRVGMGMFAGPRHLRTGSFGAQTLYARRGVMAGCSLCTTLAKLVTLSPMQEVLRRTRTSRGRLGLHLFVDDVCLATAGGAGEVVTRLRDATAALCQAVQAMGCKLADSNTLAAKFSSEPTSPQAGRGARGRDIRAYVSEGAKLPPDFRATDVCTQQLAPGQKIFSLQECYQKVAMPPRSLALMILSGGICIV